MHFQSSAFILCSVCTNKAPTIYYHKILFAGSKHCLIHRIQSKHRVTHVKESINNSFLLILNLIRQDSTNMQLLASTFVNSTAAFKSPTRAGCQSSSASKQCRMVVCSSVSNIDGQTRRAALGAGVAALFSLMATSAKAERWDGVSAAIGSCALGDEGDACRKAILA